MEETKKYCACGCGKEIIFRPWYRQRGIPNYICGHWGRGKPGLSGEKHPRWKGGKLVVCAICGRKTWKLPSHLKKWKTFCCSPKCRQKNQKGKPRSGILGILNPDWKGGKSMACAFCGKKMWRTPARLKRSKIHYCSQKCKAKDQIGKSNSTLGIPRPQTSGKANPNWKGGISKEPYPFNFNEELKKLIRKRDNYKCQLCGCPQAENIKKLTIHHIDYNKNNLDSKNLISLCFRCNSKANFQKQKWESYFITRLREKNYV